MQDSSVQCIAYPGRDEFMFVLNPCTYTNLQFEMKCLQSGKIERYL